MEKEIQNWYMSSIHRCLKVVLYKCCSILNKGCSKITFNLTKSYSGWEGGSVYDSEKHSGMPIVLVN